MDAAIELIRSGNPKPTVQQVATSAGISVRSVHHHFPGIRVVLGRATELQSARHRTLINNIPPVGPVSIRVKAICRQRRLLFEAIAPMLRAVDVWSRRSRDGHRVVAEYRSLLHDQLASTLGPEIRSRGEGGDILLQALEQATAWQSWYSSRFEQGISPAEAEELMVFTVLRLLH
jgi:AcrR family transcriptional regulator